MSVMIVNAAPYGRELFFRYGDECITIRRLARSPGINRVLIKVHPDTRVEALAPREASDDEVLDAVRQRARWIYQQLRQFRAQNEYVIPRRYVSGESHYYLGRQHLLKVVETMTERQGVKLLRGRLEVRIRHKRPDKVKQLLARWYRERAGEVFGRRLDAMLEQALWVSERPPMRVQAMQTRWGSCSPQGRLMLNPHLVKAPRECVDYVILHELCHIAEHNHSERFYRLMGQVMPQWEGIKARLDDMAGRLID